MVIDGMLELLDKSVHILMEWDPRMMNSMGTDDRNFFEKLQAKGFNGHRCGHNDILFIK